ncbi:4-oxalomesaconate tautomerase [Streptomyces rapamycinicus]|uniref:PrpF protein n=2 Tax=Streptomyces rapamycinicus TaxID=1226757 RepID=A0A3L8QZ24_STRRN|nr:4-oxalomesaconate tautomerase [Streptomyces rapamycinicus]MBB4788270.1 4-oxalomesaconate tautomerase [Streptomyces rapamycinicus]RLV72605.1 PrpF protein [Streptomyces rapamycinicus NRRL 5491]UTP36123.1 4-oxalomesaconate tautomerase [Streptomyces rapamycinicus NRRL 5491]
MSGPEGVRCMLMRGGTSKGAYFLAEDLPSGPGARDDLLLRIMGSPDPRQIDGLGGAHPLTSKVAVVSAARGPDTDVDYLFLQLGVDKADVSDRQNCGNLLAGVGPFAVERGLVAARDGRTPVRIRMVNSGDHATVTVPTPDGRVDYTGSAEIAGVPGSAAPMVIGFEQGGGPLLPTGHARDLIDGTPVTCVDNGMPTVLIAASALDVTGYEDPEELEANAALGARLQEIRRAAGRLMGLGDVSATTVPKLSLLAPPAHGGTVMTRTFIPVRCHTAIGVLGAASVAAGLCVAGNTGEDVARLPAMGERLRIEHPTGFLDIGTSVDDGATPVAQGTAVVRTARKIFDGTVFPRPA